MINYNNYYNLKDKRLVAALAYYIESLGYTLKDQIDRDLYFVRDASWVKIGMGALCAVTYKTNTGVEIYPIDRYQLIPDVIKQLKNKIK